LSIPERRILPQKEAEKKKRRQDSSFPYGGLQMRFAGSDRRRCGRQGG
jgi:hypothetical protein